MRSNRWRLFAVCVVFVSCSQGAERGRPETLHPILGRGGLGAGVPRTKPSEPVEDFAMDLGSLIPAWPNISSELPHLIRAVVARGTWKDEHHTATAMDGVLRVRHRPEVVGQVRRLVESLRARLLQPLQIQVAFVELAREQRSRVLSLDRGKRNIRWNPTAFRSAVEKGKARTLARALLSGHNGQWVLADRVSNQVFLSGVAVSEGTIAPQTTTLASGFTVQAAAWRWGEERAVVALTGLYTGEAVGAQKVTQKVHRLLPSQKTYEKNWQPHDVELELPVREMLEFQNQLTVTQGSWTVAALLPRSKDRLCAVVTRVDWRSPVPKIASAKTFSPEGYVLDVIPIALPTDTRPAVQFDKSLSIDNRRKIESSSVTWFKSRARVYQEAQKKNTFNFQAESGNVDLNLAPQRMYQQSKMKSGSSGFQARGGGGSDAGAMPAELEKLRLQVMQAEWPEGTALEFVANHVFVVHDRKLTARLRRLLEKTHEWRNNRVLVRVGFPVLAASVADGLKGNRLGRSQAKALSRGETLLPEALILGRGGSRAEIFVGEMHAVLSTAWAPDRSSPPVHVYWRGARLAVSPYLAGANQSQHLDLEWKQHRLERVAPRSVAGAILQQPTDSLWTHHQPLQLSRVASVLVGLQGRGRKLPALLVGAAW